MPFTPKQWEDYPSEETPLGAADLIDMETRLGSFASEAAAASPLLDVRKAPHTLLVQDTASGWNDWWGEGSVSYDTTTKKAGTGSVKLVLSSSGVGHASNAQTFLDAPADLSGSSIKLWVRCTDWSAVLKPQIRFGTSDTDFFHLDINNGFATTELVDDEWIECQIPRSAFLVDGAPDWSAITQVSLLGFPADASQPTLWWNFITAHPEGSTGVLSLSFDDGFEDIYTYAAPVMEEFGYVGTVYVIPELLGTAGFMSQSQIDDLHDRGWHISGHGNYNLTTLSDDALDADVRAAAVYLSERGYRGRGEYAYPLGGNDDRTRSVVKRYFRSGRGISPNNQPLGFISEHRLNCLSVWNTIDTAVVEAAVDAAVSNKEWAHLNFHHVVPTAAVELDWSVSRFTALLEYIRTSGIEVVPVGVALTTR